MINENLELLQETLDYMQEGFVFHTPDREVFFANKAAYQFLGLSQEESQNINESNIYATFIDQYENILQIEDFPVNKALNSNKSFKNYIIGNKLDNDLNWFNVNGEIIYNEDSIDYIAITFTNITQLKKNQEQLELYKHIVENADTGITVADITKEDHPLVYANPMFETLTGYSKKEVVGLNCRLLQADDRDQEGVITIAKSIKEQIPCEVELKNYKKDGTPFYNLLNLTPLFSNKNILKYYIGIQHDITKLKNLEFQFRKLVNTQNNIVIVSNGNEIDFANNKFFRFFGYKDIDSFRNQQKCICELFLTNERFFYQEKIEDGDTWIDAILKLQHAERVVSMMNSKFNVHAFSVSISQFDKENYIITFTNISQTMLENIELLEKTVRDKLTGALNREYFEQNYEKLILEYSYNENSLAIALLDIDDFKLVNDTYGHDIGDLVLVQFVETIEKFSRKDDILVRWGGEEFIIILKVKSESDLKKALEHIKKVIEIQTFSNVGQITCSIGGTIYRNNEDINQTIKRADEAVYKAKKEGKNLVQIK